MSDLIDHSALDQQLEPLCEAPRWWVGFSGGLDSTVLLHLLHRWCRANPGAPQLCAVHIHHGMQQQADDWLVHCEWVCRFLHVPFSSCQVTPEDSGRGAEAAAREARYQAFEEVLGAGDVMFFAHHLDDQVETFFLRLLRGAGVQGLSAMPAQRELGEGQLQRPLLGLRRAQLEHYARAHGLRYIDDPSNDDATLDRNFLRRELLPLLESRWPGYRATVMRAGGHIAAAAQALQEGLDLPPTEFSVAGDPGLPLPLLLDTGREQAAQLLRGWLRSGGCMAPDTSALLEFLRQLRESGSQASPRLHCRAYLLQRYRDAVYLLPRSLATAEPLPAVAIVPGQTLQLGAVGEVSLQPAPGGGLALGREQGLQLRFRQGGERCRPVRRNAGNSLKKLLQEYNLPHWWRERVPLLYRDDELLAVGALGACAGPLWRERPEAGESLWQLCWQPPVMRGFD